MSLIRRTQKPLVSLFGAAQPMLAAAKELQFHEDYTDYAFPVLGQGTISFGIKTASPFRIVVSEDKQQSRGKPVLVLDIGTQVTCFRNRNDESNDSVIASTTSPKALLEAGVSREYWFSLDRQNRRLRFGKGEMLQQLVVFECTLPAPQAGEADPYAFMAQLRNIALCQVPRSAVVSHFLWPLPVTLSLPPSLVSSDEITLDAIAENEHTVIANLPAACQVLYGNVGGAAITLNSPDFPDFAQAIEHSIMTPGCICHQKLEEKASEFGKREPDQTYLRITIGPNQGDSPGSPYVLEIWPGGHYSPIHDHGQACAVIKVLHGDIWVELYPQLQPDLLDYFSEAVFHQGDVTYLTPGLYQVHRLRNQNPPGHMTATIQCYRYPNDDTQHYEYFDYIGPTGIEHFKPNSDWEYLEFKELIRQEWANRSA